MSGLKKLVLGGGWWVAGGGECGWGRGRLAVLGVQVPRVGTVGEAVRGSLVDPVVWVAGQGRRW